jgi:hypothetical protein
MSRTALAALPLLAALALPPGEALAGPPEGASGKMAFDRVADGLRKYRKAADVDRRIGWLDRLAPTGDPRVAVALGEAMRDPGSGEVQGRAGYLLCKFFCPPCDYDVSRQWWKQSEADLRRRAARLPK